MIRLLALLVALAGPAAATPEYVLPTLFDVAGVAPDDMLNVRAEPSARGEIVARLSPGTKAVEVLMHDATGEWGLINVGERPAWVAMRYLAYRTDVWEEGALPDGLACLGTEPFWSLRHEGGQLVLATPEGGTAAQIVVVLGTGAFRDPRRAVIAGGEDLRLTAVIAPRLCSDGMSEIAYGLDASLVRDSRGETELLVGCCTIGP